MLLPFGQDLTLSALVVLCHVLACTDKTYAVQEERATFDEINRLGACITTPFACTQASYGCRWPTCLLARSHAMALQLQLRLQLQRQCS